MLASRNGKSAFCARCRGGVRPAHVKFKEGNEAREIETRPTFVVVKEQARCQIVRRSPKCQPRPKRQLVLQRKWFHNRHCCLKG
jgi:hypothetical protein